MYVCVSRWKLVQVERSPKWVPEALKPGLDYGHFDGPWPTTVAYGGQGS